MVEKDEEEQVVAQTESYLVWRSEDPELGLLFHVEFGGISLHLNSEEWDELVLLIKSADLGG